MKKKLIVFALCAISILTFSACGSKKLDLNDYIIEERTNLFTACDNMYTVTLSSGMRESDYNLDGVKNNMVEFSILTIMRNDGEPMANDNYTYVITVGEETLSGTLTKSQVDNSYSTDLEHIIPNDANINAEIKFTGYTFQQDLTNTSADFSVDMATAISIANDELNDDIRDILKDNAKIEVVTKILKDYSTEEVKRYYWYVGVISTNGDTLGILIDANSGEIIAKKV
ncbi:MAG: hypothetical protein IKC49_03275 [Clostridia bacterium]|nr:hypothetical protein [Clostridia bacterium]